MRTRWTYLALGLVIALMMAAPALAKPQFSYAVKFVCGWNPSNIGQSLDGNREGEPTVKLGGLVDLRYAHTDTERSWLDGARASCATARASRGGPICCA